MGQLERLEDRLLGDLVRTGLDHRQRVARADDDEVERAIALLHLRQRRVHDELAVMRPIRTAPTGPMKGSGETISAAEAPLMQRMSWAVTRSADSVVHTTCTSFL